MPPLSPSGRFVAAYIKYAGDKLATGNAVWHASTDDMTKDMVNRALRKPAVRKLLALHQGAEVADAVFAMTKREFSDLIARHLRSEKTPTPTFTKLAEMFLHLRGWSPAPSVEPPATKSTATKESVDEIVLALESQAQEKKR